MQYKTKRRVFKLEIDLENASFDWSSSGTVSGCEISRILQKLAEKIDTTFDREGSLLDINGNSVGSYRIIKRTFRHQGGC